jgi:flagellar hook assembly protein FlgD
MALAEKEFAPGTYDVEWNGRNSVGAEVGSGVYFYRLSFTNDEGQNIVFTKKLVMLR